MNKFKNRLTQEIKEAKILLFGSMEEKYFLVAMLCSVVGGKPLEYIVDKDLSELFYVSFCNRELSTMELLGFFHWYKGNRLSPIERKLYPIFSVENKFTSYFIYINK